jgi:porphobilinogen deaminase
MADVAAALLVVIVLAARGLNRMDASSGQTATGVPPVDWEPMLGFGALALAVGVTAVVLLRVGHRVIGGVQLTLCVFLAVHTLGSWP